MSPECSNLDGSNHMLHLRSSIFDFLKKICLEISRRKKINRFCFYHFFDHKYIFDLFLQIVFDYAGLDIEAHTGFDKRFLRPHEVPVLLGDPKKAKKKLNWSPTVGFHELAKMMYENDLKDIGG